ncbi:hypothetical protein [Staphylococcus simulans]
MSKLKAIKIALLIVILAEEIRNAKEIKNRLNYLDSEMTKLKVIRK